MTTKIRDSKGGKNPPVKCGEKILQYCSSQFILESLAIKTLPSTTQKASLTRHERKSGTATLFVQCL
jgi:hypothetical protein